MSSTLINARMDTSDRRLSNHFGGPGTVENGMTGIRTRWRNVSSFPIVAEYTRAFKCAHGQKSEELRSGERGGCTSKKLFANIYLFLLLSVRDSLLIFVQVF